jgi:serine/threonine protein kinase
MPPEARSTNALRPTPHEADADLATLQTAVGREVHIGSVLYAFLQPADRPGAIGRLGNYRVLRLLGKGGMGFVFLAEDVDLCRPVALKVMKPELDGDDKGSERFLREARAMASIKHESLVTVFQVGREQGVVYLAMELLEGCTLEEWLSRTGVPNVPALLHVGKGIAGALAAIHRRGLIHRDLKPANLWMEESSGRVKILDFGLARFINDDASLTQSGMILGTPSFMSPEQARGEALDARSDLFSFGCVLYTLCTGSMPFQGSNTTAVLTALALHDPPPVRDINQDIPPALSDLVAQMLAKEAADRPRSADEVLERLKQIERGAHDSGPSRPESRATPSPRVSPPPQVSLTQEYPAAKRPGRTWGWKRRSLAIALAFVVTFTVPLVASSVLRSKLLGGQAVSGRTAPVYLSTLEPSARENWPFLPPPKPGKPRPPGEVSIRGKISPHGIFMHPPPAWEGPASITYNLRGAYENFHAEVTLNDGPGDSESPFTFAVYGDGRVLWKSRPVQRQSDTQTCNISVKGVDRFKIEVQSQDEPRGAHAVWVEPYLTQ